MAATPDRIAFIREEFRRAVALSPTAAARHGNLARESDDPVETWFDDADDALTIATDRQALLSPERRSFTIQAVGLDEVQAIGTVGAAPVARFVDTDRGVDAAMLIGSIVMDFETGRATLAVWG
jgi:hypothetical protein